MQIIKAPTKTEIDALISERDAAFEAAIPKLKEECILYINDALSKHNWGTLKRLSYGSHTIEIPFDIFRPYLNIDPMYDLPNKIHELLKKDLDEAGYHVFSSTGAQKAIYFSLSPKEALP